MEQIFQTPQELLSSESWRLMLNQKSEKKIFMEKQKQLLQEIKEW